MDKTYNITFNGDILPNFESKNVKENTSRLLKLTPEKTEILFSGQRITLKKDLNEEMAQKFKAKLESIGLYITLEAQHTLNNTNVFAQANNPYNAQQQQPMIFENNIRPQTDLYRSPREKYLSRDYIQYQGDYEVEPPSLFAFNIQGRYGRLNYINAFILYFLMVIIVIPIAIFTMLSSSMLKGSASQLLSQLAMGSILFFIAIILIFSLFYYRIIILRLHDLNRSGWWVLIFILSPLAPFLGPILSFLIGLLLLCVPGTPTQNNYGNSSRQGPIWGLVFLIAIIGVALIEFVYWV